MVRVEEQQEGGVVRVALPLMSARVLQGERRTPGEYAHLPAVARLRELDSLYDTHRQERH
jgi:hypothetical protein